MKIKKVFHAKTRRRKERRKKKEEIRKAGFGKEYSLIKKSLREILCVAASLRESFFPFSFLRKTEGGKNALFC